MLKPTTSHYRDIPPLTNNKSYKNPNRYYDLLKKKFTPFSQVI